MSVQLRSASALFMGKESLVLIGEEVGLDPESFWILWRREKCPSLKVLGF